MSYMIIEPLIMRVMSFFYSGKDEKFSAEESLRVTFCNVCNALLMATRLPLSDGCDIPPPLLENP